MSTTMICLALAVLIPFLIHIPLGIARLRAKNFDIRYPRQIELSGWGKRIYAAHFNALESLAYFTPAVLIAYVLKADPDMSSKLAMAFVIARSLHPVFYALNLGWLRFTSWLVGVGASLGLIYISVF